MRQAVLILSLDQNAVFTARAATEGDHQTLDYIPGSALLGVAAVKLYNDQRAGDPFRLFHSGAVRFSNAVPLTASGVPAFPLPQVLREPKHRRGGVVDNMLNADVVRVGEDPNNAAEQYDALPRCHVGSDLSIARPRTGRRLRTALSEGRAATGRLFGYSHVAAGQTFAATIEADGLEDDQWKRLLSVFDGTVLSLGRSRRAEYGGEARSCVTDEKLATGLWPESTKFDGKSDLLVWALSDLALTDRVTGIPTLSPRLEDLFPGLGLSSALNRSQSAVGQRRYAPWNSFLGGRESERSIITAGSVLWFTSVAGDADVLPALVGQHQEAGLGRIWINPPMLPAWGKGPLKAEVTRLSLPRQLEVSRGATAVEPAEATAAGNALMLWMKCVVDRRSAASQRNSFVATFERELKGIYIDIRMHYGPDGGPSRSQWGEVLHVLRTSKDRNAIEQALFAKKGERRAVCGVKSDKDRQSSWGATFIAERQGKRSPTTVAEWLQEKMKASEGLPHIAFVEVFEALAKCGQRLAQQETKP